MNHAIANRNSDEPKAISNAMRHNKERFMTADILPAARSKPLLWTSHLLTGLVVVFLLFNGIIKLIKIEPVIESFIQLGYPPDVSRGIGTLELAITLLYAIPRTAILGAILLTGLLGGAVASHLRLGDPLFTHVLFGVYLGALAWGGLYLREPRLRALVPLGR